MSQNVADVLKIAGAVAIGNMIVNRYGLDRSRRHAIVEAWAMDAARELAQRLERDGGEPLKLSAGEVLELEYELGEKAREAIAEILSARPAEASS